MIISYIVIFFSAFLLVSFFIFLFKKLSFRYNLLISSGIPLIGGLAMGLGFWVVSLFVYFARGRHPREIIGIIITSMAMFAFGVIDDRKELSIKAKFLVQVIAVTLLILFGIKTQIVYIGNLLNIIITFLWVLGITNAFNHLDVIDGLAAGAAMIISLSFFIISLLVGNINIAILSLTLVAATAAFLIFNFPPAKIYMGNSGSHFLGFLLAATAISISYAPLERKIALLSPILILGLPLFDTTFLILARLKNKTLPFKKSNDHLALKFLSLGYSKKKALLMMLILCLFFSFCGILVSQATNLFSSVIISFVVLISLAIMLRMNKIPTNG